jgi:hypothetical protein
MSESKKDEPAGSAAGESEPKSKSMYADPVFRELEARVTDLTTPPAGRDASAPDTPEERELQRRQAFIERLYRQASESRERALREQKRAAALSEQLAQRDSALEQAKLDLEIQSQQLDSDRQQITEQRELLSTDIEGFEQQLERLAQREAASRRVRRVGRFAIQLRAISIALIGGLAGGASWMVLHVGDDVTSFGRIHLSGRPERFESHLAGLMSLAPVAADDAVVERWRRAVASGRVTIQSEAATGDAILAVRGAGAVENEALISAAVDAYGQAVRVVSGAQSDPRWQVWSAASESLAQRLGALRESLEMVERAQAGIPETADWLDARTQFEALQQSAREVGEALATARGTLLALEAQDAPRGVVTTDDFAAALSNDPIYQQDSLEFDEHAKAYQSQLLLAQILIADPLSELQKTLIGLAATIAEQIELNPPLAARTLLEEMDSEVGDLQRLLQQFAGSLDSRRTALERLDPAGAVVAMFTLQSEAMDSAQRVSDEIGRVAALLRETVREMAAAPSAGTRETVISSVLRGEISRVDDDHRRLVEQIGKLDTQKNFELDAADRQVRSLRTRQRDRQERVRATLQEQVDAAAAGTHQNALSAARARVSELDEEREFTLRAIVDQLEVLREREATSRLITALDAQRDVLTGQISVLERQMADHSKQEPRPKVDRVELVGLSHEATEAKQHWRSAGVVGSVIFASCWLVSTLMLSRFAGGASVRSASSSRG